MTREYGKLGECSPYLHTLSLLRRGFLSGPSEALDAQYVLHQLQIGRHSRLSLQVSISFSSRVRNTGRLRNMFLMIFSNGTLWTNYRMKLTGPCNMNLKRFPFDTQTCLLTFESSVSSFSLSLCLSLFQGGFPGCPAVIFCLASVHPWKGMTTTGTRNETEKYLHRFNYNTGEVRMAWNLPSPVSFLKEIHLPDFEMVDFSAEAVEAVRHCTLLAFLTVSGFGMFLVFRKSFWKRQTSNVGSVRLDCVSLVALPYVREASLLRCTQQGGGTN